MIGAEQVDERVTVHGRLRVGVELRSCVGAEAVAIARRQAADGQVPLGGWLQADVSRGFGLIANCSLI